MKTCPHCGTRIPVDSRFCYYCMTSLDEKTPVKPVRRRLWLRVGALALACLVAGGLTAWGILALISGGSPETPPASSVGATPETAASSVATGSEAKSRAAASLTESSTTPASSAAPSSAEQSAVEAGTTGTCTWQLEENGTLTIVGQGATADYSVNDAAPWQSYYLDVTTIRVEPGVTYLGSYAFRNMMAAETVSLPDTLTGMGSGIFSSSGITAVTLPAGVTDLPDNTFNFCVKLESVTLGKGLRTIGDNAFNSCSLKEITLPEGMVSIGKKAFRYSGLTRITIPASVTSIGDNAFDAGVTLVTTKGSAADRYAQENGLKVEYLN